MVNENPLIKAMDSVNWKEELERLVKSGIDINRQLCGGQLSRVMRSKWNIY